MSPDIRRSSRAKVQSPLIAQTSSSTSSVTSDRAQRTTRFKPSSPRQSIPRSQSQDDPADDATKAPPRRTRSGGNEIKEPSTMIDDHHDEEEEEGGEENEVTRCVCRQSDFPGMCSSLMDLLKRVNYVHDPGQENVGIGEFFVQCDDCKVWQHGGCVAIVGDEYSPDDYWCEECRRDLHKLASSPEGQRYSRYAPVMAEPPYRLQSEARRGKAKESKPKQIDARNEQRRQTKNSREQDELDRVLEESKRDILSIEGNATTTAQQARPGKRSRDDSHEYVTFSSTIADPKAVVFSADSSGSDYGGEVPTKQLTKTAANRRKSATSKRPRTDSNTPTFEPKAEEASETDPLDPAAESTPRSKVRGAAARVKEAQNKERQKQAAANARQQRSERRRLDESDHEEAPKEELVPSTAASSPPPELPPSSLRTAKKKPTPARRGRGQKNQQTHEQESPPPDADESLLAANPHNTRARSRSRSVVRGDDPEESRSGLTPNGNSGARAGVAARDGISVPRGRELNGTFDDGGLLSKPSKVKNFNEKRTSLSDMRKRVAAISEFVGRAQVERPPSKSTSMSRSESETGGNASGNTSGGNGSTSTNSNGVVDSNNVLGVQRKKQLHDIIRNDNGPEFGAMTTEEMLENMRLRTQAWQELYGKYGDK